MMQLTRKGKVGLLISQGTVKLTTSTLLILPYLLGQFSMYCDGRGIASGGIYTGYDPVLIQTLKSQASTFFNILSIYFNDPDLTEL